MARSPFQGTWSPAIMPTVVTAPDALVFINGETSVMGCPACKRKFEINKYITSVQVDLSIDSVPGSATINLAIPRHTVDEFYFEGEPLISPMMEVEIYAKGHFLLEGLPQYYPIFWGVTNQTSEQCSGGEHTFNINCSDILKWWELCKININPAFTQAQGQFGRNLFGNVFMGSNPYDVIWSLAQQSFGDVVIGSGSLVSLYREKGQTSTFARAFSDMMRYWNERFSRIRSNLLLYGSQGIAVRGQTLYDSYRANATKGGQRAQQGSTYASKTVREANGGAQGNQMVFDPTDGDVRAFRTQFQNAGQVSFWSAEYQSKLEIANAAKEAIGYEFFMDVTGDIVYKPPFYNLDVIGNKPVSWIQDVDIYDYDFSESESEVVTQLTIQGSFGGSVDYGMGEDVTPFTSVTDYHLLRKYGWRPQTFNSEFMGNDLQAMFYMGMDLMDKYNARRFRGSVTIPIRPELRLGFPVYIASKDQIWYVQGISHNIPFGGRAQTTLTLTAKRGKFIAPRGIGSISLTSYKSGKSSKAQPLQNRAQDDLSGTDAVTPGDGVNPGIDRATLDSRIQRLTVKQLASGGTWELKLGDAATIPPGDVDVGENGPYAPLLLRHPKTGRLMGYPNVVMVYRSPFTPSGSTAKAEGRRTPEQQSSLIKKGNAKAQAMLEELAKTMHTFTKTDETRERAYSSRYNYGLNSAGVYVYAHDEDEAIREILLFPRNRITASRDGADVSKELGIGPSAGKSQAMIRPVSDNRGFEVIGHYKYGRGISLKDGSLVVAGPDNTNLKAQVDLQLALSGPMFEMLTAQSQGITTISGMSSNPAKAVAELSLDDTETAAVLNPTTGGPEIVNSGTNFVDAAPLGSAAASGVPVSVEASQLSRALTLAEMKVKDDMLSVSEECGCLTGRADLAFLNLGLNVNLNTGVVPDLSDPFEGERPDVDLPSIYQQGQDAADAYFNAESAKLDGGQNEEYENYKAEMNYKLSGVSAKDFESTQAEIHRLLEKKYYEILDKVRQEADMISKNTANQLLQDQDARTVPAEGSVLDSMYDNSPLIDGSTTKTLTQTALGKVDIFLTNLYEALDTPHQEYERVLRGEMVESTEVNVDETRFGKGNPTDVSLSPPFSTPGRALGGDPEALAKTVTTTADNMSQTWQSFGDKIRGNALETQYNTRIDTNTRELGKKERERERLENSKGSLVIVPGDLNSQIERLDKDIQNIQRQIDDDKMALVKLRSEQ